MDDFEKGLLLGLLIGEGHFGGDGRQPQVTIRMHVRHEPLFRWLARVCPGSRLYGPYAHGGRAYYQWMARGETLRGQIVPLLDTIAWGQTDPHSFERYRAMKMRYRLETAEGSGSEPRPIAASTDP